MDRRLILLNLRLGVAIVLVSVLMLAISFIWAASYLG